MKTTLRHLMLSIGRPLHIGQAVLFALIALALSSCAQLQEHVAIVDDRRPDGTYKSLEEVVHPETGSPAVAVGKLYVFKDGKVAKTILYGASGPVSAPKLSLGK